MMSLIAGFLVALILFPPLRTLRCSTPILPTISPVTPIFTPMARGFPAVGSDTAGGPSALVSAGRRLPWANGCGILVSAGPLPATSPGVGLPITMAAGSLMILAAAGFIRRQFITDSEVTAPMEATEVTRESGFRP